MTQTRLIYVTTGSEEEAGKIAEQLVQARKVACANVIGPMRSTYWWQGEVQHDEETILILKTTERWVEAVTDEIKQLHSYDCPCVVVLPVVGGNPDFLAWIEAQTVAPG